MLEKLKADLKRLEDDITRKKKLTEAFDLKTEREQLTSRLREIDKRLELFDMAGTPIQTPTHNTNLVLEDRHPEAQTRENAVRTMTKIDSRLD